jgi:hypothetical protein
MNPGGSGGTGGSSAVVGTAGIGTGGENSSAGGNADAGSDVSGAGGEEAGASTGGVGSGGRTGGGGSASGGRASGGERASGGNARGGRTARGGSTTGGAGTGGRAGSGGTPTGGSDPGGAEAGAHTDTGGVGAGGSAGSGAAATGGRGSGGAGDGGATGSAGSGPEILWTDSIQSGVDPWGLDGYGVEHPIGTEVTPSDANGANFSVVADPLGGDGLAIRHFATFDTGGSRSQGGLYGDVNTIFGNQAKRPEGIWVAQQWYFPEAIDAGGDAYCWINLWDWHSIDADRGNRWHTSPGLMLARDGSMKVVWEWGGPANSINPTSEYSTIALPVGRWFDIEMHYVWSDTPTATISLWIDGQLAIEQSGVQTRADSHQVVETYLKFYGSTQGRGPWVPTPSLKYTRNVRVAAERIWR